MRFHSSEWQFSLKVLESTFMYIVFTKIKKDLLHLFLSKECIEYYINLYLSQRK